ncbi:FAD synthase [Candidatus Woesearchaeota archaeon]|nr:FAD synthase [Candidatus Woesearchaeota archaeon]
MKETVKAMVFGTFDNIHLGHMNLITQAKRYANYIIAVVARDDTVEKIKGRTPKNNEKVRLEHVRTIKAVDKVVLGNLSDYYGVIEEYNPNYICLGYDQESSITKNIEEELKKRYLKAKVIRLRSYRPDLYKSSKVKDL